MQEPKASKRIVSRGEYVKAQGKRISLGLSGFGLFVISGVCVLTLLLSGVLSLVLWAFDLRTGETHMDGGLVSLLIAVLSLFVSCWMVRFTRATLRHAANIDTGVPLTRANTADLPATDSLVRASEESAQAQEGVLLRAATPTQERHEEQLLRPTPGEQKEEPYAC